MFALSLPTVTWHRSRSGDVLINLEFQPLKLPTVQFSGSDSVRPAISQRWLLTTVMGLALGLGLAIGVSMRPDQLDAVPSVVVEDSHKPVITKIVLPNQEIPLQVSAVEHIEVAWWSQRHFAQHLLRSSKPGAVGTIIIGGKATDELFASLEKITLGDTITLTGSNQGVYRYRVIELRTVSQDELTKVTQHFTETLVVYTASNQTGSELLVVIARPG